MEPRFDLNLLNALDMLLRERSVTAAGKRLGVSQSAMSGMLARLREQLQDPLLVRAGNGLVLTPRAEALAPQVRQIRLRLQAMIVPETAFDLGSVRRRFRIMASEHSMLLILPFVFRRAAELAPGLTFEILSIDDPMAKVADGEVDLCLAGGPLDELGKAASEIVRTRKVLHDPFVAIVDTAHPGPHDRISLDELARYPHVSTHFSGVARSVEQIILPDGAPDVAVAIRVPGFLALGPALEGSGYVGIVPSGLVPLMTKMWRLRVIGLPDEVPPATVRALWHERNHADPAHRWLRLTIEEACAALDRETCRAPAADK